MGTILNFSRKLSCIPAEQIAQWSPPSRIKARESVHGLPKIHPVVLKQFFHFAGVEQFLDVSSTALLSIALADFSFTYKIERRLLSRLNVVTV